MGGQPIRTLRRDSLTIKGMSSTATEPETALPAVLKAALDGVVGAVERDMEARLNAARLPENLREALKYAVLGPGKRLRPALTILACEALGGKREQGLAAAGAMELIHCFSLVHDDLPAMDDDDLRRGRPTLHIHAGEAMAILAGDACVSLAFEWLASAPMSESQQAALVRELSSATTAMIAGQVYDTLGGFASKVNDRQKLDLIHRHKTAALITASCRMGAICASASPAHLDALSRYGQSIGLMFQIVDDLLDVTQSAEHVGKAVGKDVSAGKLTFPGLLGVEASRAEVERLRIAAHDALLTLGENARLLLDLADAMAVRTR